MLLEISYFILGLDESNINRKLRIEPLAPLPISHYK